MTEFAHAVNFTMSFGVTVLPEEINKIRKIIESEDYNNELMLYDIELTKDSTDEEIANYIGLEDYTNHLLSECVNMEMEEHHVYNEKDTKRLSDEYHERLAEFKKRNKIE